MALCVAKSLLDHERMNVDDVTLNMVRWYKEGAHLSRHTIYISLLHNNTPGYLSAIDTCFDIGAQTQPHFTN